jgi:sugar/nucleoside kinase (ribokinase family)
MITPAVVMLVDDFPQHNTGVPVKEVGEFVFDDASIVAGLLREWSVPTGLIGTVLGDDPAGHRVADKLNALGILGQVRFSSNTTTSLEVNISDPSGGRTFFWQRPPDTLASLDTADLTLLTGARLLYVDWYDGDHILRPMRAAEQKDIPVFLNLEYGHQEPDILERYTQGTTICQVITDPAQSKRNPLAVAQKVLRTGVETVLVTLWAGGCLVAQGTEAIRILGPTVPTIDGCGAGATFSAGFIYGYLHGWDMEKAARFATAAASLKCTVIGPRTFPVDEVNQMATKLQVQRFLIPDA